VFRLIDGPPSWIIVDVPIARFIDMCQYWAMSMNRAARSCCAPVLRARLRSDEAEELAAAFKAIADPARLRLLGFVTAAYWFTASTSFANPAVTVARAATDTFTGIRPVDAPAFVGAQLLGAVAAAVLLRWLMPHPGGEPA